MSRRLDGTDDYMRMAVSATATGFTFGTMAVLMKKNTDVGWLGVMNFHNTAMTTAGTGLELSPLAGDGARMYMSWWTGSAFVNTKNPASILASDNWFIFVVGKSTGSVLGTWSWYDVDGGTWSHGNMDIAAGNSSLGTRGQCMLFGRWEGGDFLNGWLGAAAVWPGVNLTNPQRESLWPSMAGWVSLAPEHAWQFNQASTATPVPDLMAHGGDQAAIVGTSVSVDEPTGWSYYSAGGPSTARPRKLITGTSRAVQRASRW
jgi:hypothetical protein